MRKCSIVQAVNLAIAEEMRRDTAVFLMGEDITHNVYGYSLGLVEEFGDLRVRDTPLSEAAYTGAGVGAAICGLRPIVDWTRAGCCAYVSMDQLVNMAAKYTYTYGGQYSVPLVIMTMISYDSGLASQHSDRPHSMFMSVPGIKIVMPSCAKDAYGLLKAAIRTNDPVMFIRDSTIPRHMEEIPDDINFLLPIGKGVILKNGMDITIVGIGNYVNICLKLAIELEKKGISCEVINPRTIKPFDYELVEESVKKTGRLIVVDSANEICSLGRDVVAVISSQCFYELKAPATVLASKDVHVPYSPKLEKYVYPREQDIYNAVTSMLSKDK